MKKKGLDDFNKKMIAAVRPLIDKLLERYRTEAPESFHRNFLDDDAVPPDPRLSPNEAYTVRVWRLFVEIVHTHEAMLRAQRFLRLQPPPAYKRDVATYVRYHVEHWFHELYILRERLVAFAALVARGHRHTSSSSRFRKVADLLREYAEQVLQPYSDVRSRHVHEFRIDLAGASKLETLEFIAQHSKLPSAFHRQVLAPIRRSTKADWCKALAKRNKTVRANLDEFLAVLADVIFKPSGELILPYKA